MAELEIMLRCTGCGVYRPFERPGKSKQVVRCVECGKRHSVDSLHAVDPDDVQTRSGPS